MQIINRAKVRSMGIPIVVISVVFTMFGNGYAFSFNNNAATYGFTRQNDSIIRIDESGCMLPGVSDIGLCDSTSLIQARMRAQFLCQLAKGVRLSSVSDFFSASQSETKSDQYQLINCLSGRMPFFRNLKDSVQYQNGECLVFTEPVQQDSTIYCTDSVDFKFWFFAKERRVRRADYLTDLELYRILNGTDTVEQWRYRLYKVGRALEISSKLNDEKLSQGSRRLKQLTNQTAYGSIQNPKVYSVKNGLWVALICAITETVSEATSGSSVMSKNLTESYENRFNSLNREVLQNNIAIRCNGWQLSHDSLYIDLHYMVL